jgi:hypothetical protein
LVALIEAPEAEILLGAVQLKLTPLVEELAVRVMLGLAQVRSVAPVLLAIARPAGDVVFWATTVLVMVVQPLTGLVTVSVYVPAVEVVGVAPVAVKPLGPVQA